MNPPSLEEPDVSKPEPCTSWSLAKQHLSVDLEPHPTGGCRGRTLCKPGGVPAVAYDHEAINAALAGRGEPPMVVADLPLCKLCANKAGRLADNPNEETP